MLSFATRHFMEHYSRILFFKGFLYMLTAGLHTTDQDHLPQTTTAQTAEICYLFPKAFWENMAQQLKNLHLKLIFLMLQFVQFDHPQLVKRLRCSSDMWRTNHGDFPQKAFRIAVRVLKRSGWKNMSWDIFSCDMLFVPYFFYFFLIGYFCLTFACC